MLRESKLVKSARLPVKVLGSGDLSVKLTVEGGVHRFVALVDPLAQPPADDSDAEMMDIGPT